ncbi:unnamed protein product [Echinostoma caproni]|uniref:Uncharacterized protein n=1 Tax=Echinostoma caproni TaxID=27848 RepID=A0A3P8I4V9_9TREM|nr:unnamed protein product [Echinostoma caproni]
MLDSKPGKLSTPLNSDSSDESTEVDDDDDDDEEEDVNGDEEVEEEEEPQHSANVELNRKGVEEKVTTSPQLNEAIARVSVSNDKSKQGIEKRPQNRMEADSISPRSSASHTPSAGVCSVLLNYPLAEGRTLLHVAVEFQQEPEVVSLLLESGCDPTIR